MKQKIVLAFSGGLDTTFSIPYLQEKEFDVVTVTVNSGGFDEEELATIEKKSKEMSAIEHYTIDGQDKLFDQIIKWTIMSNGLYEGSYPNMCADRYLIAEECIKIAKKVGANHIAHGSTAMGNDQVRFNLALATLAPEIKIIEPIKDPMINGSRAKEMEYLEQKGFEVASKHKKYSVNQNVMGITYSGSEIDQDEEPSEEIFKLTNNQNSKNNYFEIGFESGIPVSLNGVKMKGIEILKTLNKEAGACGFGKSYYTGDCMIGIKGHIVFEAPGMLALIKAHQAIEQYVLTKPQIEFGKFVSTSVSDMIYTGKLYDPLMENLKKYLIDNQKNITGTVKLKAENGNLLPVSVKSDKSLVKSNIATYAQGCSWNADEANGFIKLFGLQSQIAHKVNNNKD